MSALELIQLANAAIFTVIFITVTIAAVRRPSVVKVDIALLFGLLAYVVVQSRVLAAIGVTPPLVLGLIAAAATAAIPYVLLRLANDFSYVPPRVMRASEIGLALIMALFVAFQPPRPPFTTVLFAAHFAFFAVYSAVVFIRHAQRSQGVTRRRMEAIGAGAVLLGLALVVVGIDAVFLRFAPVGTAVVQVLGLAAALAWLFGFAPPRALRRAWQEPELRAFLVRAASLPRLPDTASIVRELEDGAAASTGANATILLWDEDEGVLRVRDRATGDIVTLPPERYLTGRVFASQRAMFFTGPAARDPARAAPFRRPHLGALLAAPITAGARRLGVLAVYASREPVFAEDDIELVQLLADQAAVILESRALIDEAAAVRAHEESARMKDDFVSAAAHDLKTPLTTLVGQAQVLERRSMKDPNAPADVVAIRRIASEAQRLNTLVEELLDASRVEQGRLDIRPEQLDLAEVVRHVCERDRPDRERVRFSPDGALVGAFDRHRILQLLENLIENALKYSPAGEPVEVRTWRADGDARVSVSDKGIGIVRSELSHVFERYRRGRNVDDRRFAGMGLGLYICRGIVELHRGRIWAESEVGEGSTFHVALPLDAGVGGGPG